MAFSTTAQLAGARALDVDQFRQALIGLMPDQPITIGQLLTVQGRALSLQQLTSPTIASYTDHSSTGAAANYKTVANNDDGDAVPGPAFATPHGGTGPSNYVALNIPPAPGAKVIKVLKQPGQTGPYLQIGSYNQVQGQTANYTFNDQGAAGSSYTASTTSPGGRISRTKIIADIFQSNVQAITSPPTQVTLDHEGGSIPNVPGDPLFMADLTNHRIIVPYAGIYMVVGRCEADYNRVTQFTASVRVNGGLIIPGSASSSASSPTNTAASAVCGLVVCNAGDNIALYCENATAGFNTTVGENRTFLQVALVD